MKRKNSAEDFFRRERSYKGPDVVGFLRRLLREIPGKLLIIWDGSPSTLSGGQRLAFLKASPHALTWNVCLPMHPRSIPRKGSRICSNAVNSRICIIICRTIRSQHSYSIKHRISTCRTICSQHIYSILCKGVISTVIAFVVKVAAAPVFAVAWQRVWGRGRSRQWLRSQPEAPVGPLPLGELSLLRR